MLSNKKKWCKIQIVATVNNKKSQERGEVMRGVTVEKLLEKSYLTDFERSYLRKYFSKINFVVDNEIIKELRILTEDGKRFYCSKDVFKMLGYKKDETFRFTKRTNKILKDFVNPQFRCTFPIIKELPFLTENEFLSVLQRCRTKSKYELNEIKNNLVQKGLLKDALVLEDTKEQSFIQLLFDVLEPFGFEVSRQYSVLSYRLDAYIHDLNLAIEYDENDHCSYSYNAHELRQQEIEEHLGCSFVRVSDKKTNAYNVGVVLKKILEMKV